jgi:hypothetical protein
MLSLLSGVIYKRWLADTLTTVKGFDRTAIETLSFSGKSIDWDMRIICDASRLGIPIAEIPVRYQPRRIDQGKKITAAGGLSALLTLLFGKFNRSK